jgi:hypothetical protein
VQQLSSQLSCADTQQHMTLPLAVANATPALFLQHVLPFLDGDSKHALNVSCQRASKHVRPAPSPSAGPPLSHQRQFLQRRTPHSSTLQ